MKMINKRIFVSADFHAVDKIFNQNKEPKSFIYEDRKVEVQKILKVYEEKIVGNRRIVFVCQHNGRDIYELKYEIDSTYWYMFKK